MQRPLEIQEKTAENPAKEIIPFISSSSFGKAQTFSTSQLHLLSLRAQAFTCSASVTQVLSSDYCNLSYHIPSQGQCKPSHTIMIYKANYFLKWSWRRGLLSISLLLSNITLLDMSRTSKSNLFRKMFWGPLCITAGAFGI